MPFVNLILRETRKTTTRIILKKYKPKNRKCKGVKGIKVCTKVKAKKSSVKSGIYSKLHYIKFYISGDTIRMQIALPRTIAWLIRCFKNLHSRLSSVFCIIWRPLEIWTKYPRDLNPQRLKIVIVGNARVFNPFECSAILAVQLRFPKRVSNCHVPKHAPTDPTCIGKPTSRPGPFVLMI